MSNSPLITEGQRAPLADEASPDMYEELVNTGITRLVRMKMLPGATDEPPAIPRKSSISSRAAHYPSNSKTARPS